MNPPRRSTLSAVHLDAVRGLSAVMVVLAHVRTLFVRNDGLIDEKGNVLDLRYWAFNHGSTAVMIFFVLSGYFIASSIRRATLAERWSWRRYADARLTRLLVPLIPALLLVVFWDRLGQSIVGYAPYGSMATGPADRYDLSLSSFFGNLVFFQRILVPVFGSNGPLWSLGNEFWYYVVFPLLYFAVRPKYSFGLKLLFAGVALACLGFVGKIIVGQFPVWLMGAAIAFVPAKPWAARWPFRLGASLLLLLMTLRGVVYKIPSMRLEEYLVGFASAVLIYSLACGKDETAPPLYDKVATSLSGISYTLYLTHYPVLVFASFYFMNGTPAWQMNGATILKMVLVTLALIAYAVPIWWLAEKRTAKIRSLLDRKAPQTAG